jgi:hypothetical protein
MEEGLKVVHWSLHMWSGKLHTFYDAYVAVHRSRKNEDMQQATLVRFTMIISNIVVENSLGIEFINRRSNQNKSASIIAIPNR